jgi:hypothetical protein
MPEDRAVLESISFKPVPGGFVYRAPRPWLFGPTRHYLISESQKAEISAIMTPRRPILFQLALWMAFSFMVAAAGGIVWAFTGHREPTAVDVVAMVALIVVEVFAGLRALRWRQMRRLRPILADLPLTDQRITDSEVRQALAAGVNAMSVKQLAANGAISVMAFTACLIGFLIDVILGQSIAFFFLAGTILFGIVAAVWFRRLIDNAELKRT